MISSGTGVDRKSLVERLEETNDWKSFESKSMIQSTELISLAPIGLANGLIGFHTGDHIRRPTRHIFDPGKVLE